MSSLESELNAFDYSGQGGEIFHEKREGARRFFTNMVYGKFPEDPPEISIGLLEEGPIVDPRTGNKKGYRRQLGVVFTRAGNSFGAQVLIQAPSEKGKYKALVSPLIYPPHTATDDLGVLPSSTYSIQFPRREIPFREEDRGSKRDRFDMDKIVAGGYAAVAYSYNDIVPDAPAGPEVGAYALYPELMRSKNAPRAIAMWAWSMSHIARAVSYDSLIDGNSMAVMGFSRLGKAVHVALAHEHPFKAGIAVASGKGGAAPLKSGEGEPTLLMASLYQPWYRPEFLSLAASLEKIPFGQKYLLAESDVPVLVSVDETDVWSAPGKQRKTVNSANKIRIKRGLRPTLEFVTHRVGGHTVSPHWKEQYLNFLDRNL